MSGRIFVLSSETNMHRCAGNPHCIIWWWTELLLLSPWHTYEKLVRETHTKNSYEKLARNRTRSIWCEKLAREISCCKSVWHTYKFFARVNPHEFLVRVSWTLDKGMYWRKKLRTMTGRVHFTAQVYVDDSDRHHLKNKTQRDADGWCSSTFFMHPSSPQW